MGSRQGAIRRTLHQRDQTAEQYGSSSSLWAHPQVERFVKYVTSYFGLCSTAMGTVGRACLCHMAKLTIMDLRNAVLKESNTRGIPGYCCCRYQRLIKEGEQMKTITFVMTLIIAAYTVMLFQPLLWRSQHRYPDIGSYRVDLSGLAGKVFLSTPFSAPGAVSLRLEFQSYNLGTRSYLTVAKAKMEVSKR